MTPGHWIDPFDANPRPKPLGIPRGRLERIKAEEPPVAQPDRWACAMPSDEPPAYYTYAWPNGELQPVLAPTPEPAAKEGEWITHDGRAMPVPRSAYVEIRLQDGFENVGDAALWAGGTHDWWTSDGGKHGRITHYRLIPQGAQS